MGRGKGNGKGEGELNVMWGMAAYLSYSKVSWDLWSRFFSQLLVFVTLLRLVTSTTKIHPPSIWTHQRRPFLLAGHFPIIVHYCRNPVKTCILTIKYMSQLWSKYNSSLHFDQKYSTFVSRLEKWFIRVQKYPIHRSSLPCRIVQLGHKYD